MSIGIIILIVVGSILALFLLFAFLYLAFGWNKWLFHNLLGWHKPIKENTLNGTNIISKCKYCGKEIAQDSQGNWFEVE